MKTKEEIEEDFYGRCAEILKTTHNYDAWVEYLVIDRETGELITRDRSRWGPRKPGNGRFPGFGLIRYFGPNVIHVCLTKPILINQKFSSKEEVFDFLSNI